MQRAVLAGDAETGVSIMAMDEGLDTGPVYRMVTLAIDPGETSGELFERLAGLGAEALEDFLRAFPDVPAPQPQDESGATHAAMLEKAEGEVDWSRSTEAIVDHVRGMDPWPGAYTTRSGDRLKLFGASGLPGPMGAIPGTVLGLEEGALRVAAHDGSVLVTELQPAGKKRMSAASYVAGRPFGDAEVLGT